MKLRIRGDSIRLRLTRSEVQKIAAGQQVQENTRLLGQRVFQYILEPMPSISEIQASYQDHKIIVQIPAPMASDWAGSEKIELKHHQEIPGESETKLFILIEKDFACLKPRIHETEDESDMFINPNEAFGACNHI